MKNKKYTKLFLGIFFDALGLLSFTILGIGEFQDIIWAPASAYLMTKMYKGKKGKIAAVISFIEEALPFLDVIPTFTLMWIYVYIFKTNEVKKTINV